MNEAIRDLAAKFKKRLTPVADLPVRERPPHEEYGYRLEEAADRFREYFPDDWAALNRCPLQHGLEAMIEKLKG